MPFTRLGDTVNVGQRVFKKVEFLVGSSSVSVLLKGVVDGFEWV